MSTESNHTETIEPKPKPKLGAIRPLKPVPVPSAPVQSAPVRPVPARQIVEDDDDEDEGGSGKGKVIMGLVVLAAIGGVIFAAKQFSTSGPAPQKQETQIIAFLPPPPPPPPPPKPTPPPEVVQEKKQMIVQDEIKEPEEKPDDKPQPPAPQMSTGIKGPGGDASLAGSGNGTSFGGPPKKRGSQFGWYAGPVQNRVADALRTNRATRSAKLEGVLVKIWPDSNARISRVEFKTGTGQPAVDDAIRQALFGLSLDAPPPADMPLPIILRLSAKTGFTAQR